MIVYLLCFLLAITAAYLSWKNDNKKIFAILFIAVALIIPCIVAGARGKSVGTDVQVYAERLYDKSVSSSSFEKYQSSGWNVGWGIKRVSEYEIGFSTLVFVVAKITRSFAAVLFAIQLFTIVPIYLGLKHFLHNKKYIWLGIAAYCCLFYCSSLNMMRQMIGASICFYAVSLLFCHKRSYLKTIALIIVASLFHTSSLLALLVVVFCMISKMRTSLRIGKSKIMLKTAAASIAIFITALILFVPGLLNSLLMSLGFGGYTDYVSGDASLSIGHIILRLPLLALVLYVLRQNKEKNEKVTFFVVVAFLDLLLASLSTGSMYVSRISILFQLFYVASIPYAIEVCALKRKIILTVLFIAYFIAYWYVYYVVMGVGHVVPYIIS